MPVSKPIILSAANKTLQTSMISIRKRTGQVLCDVFFISSDATNPTWQETD